MTTTDVPTATASVPVQSPPTPSRRVRLVDVVVGGALFLLMLLGVVANGRLFPELVVVGLAPQLALGAVMTLPLTVRRRWPLAVLWTVTLAFGVFRVIGGMEVSVSSVALFVAIYTVGAELPPHRSRLPRAVVVGAMALFVLYSVLVEPLALSAIGSDELVGFDRTVLTAFSLGLNLLFFVAAWVIGDLVWKHRCAEQELEATNSALSLSRHALARRAVQDERIRIARELHDVVAHHVSVMGIQAGAARRAIGRDPDRAGQALAGVEQASRDAVAELHQLLGFLRNDEEPVDVPAPQPTLDELDPLIESVRDVGLDVTLTVTGRRRRLPDSVELSVFRIVQEALTNSLRHADGASHAEVHLVYERDRLRITVRDDGAPRPVADAFPTARRGLVGMRERAALHAGELRAGPGPDGGFEVDGWLPIRESVS